MTRRSRIAVVAVIAIIVALVISGGVARVRSASPAPRRAPAGGRTIDQDFRDAIARARRARLAPAAAAAGGEPTISGRVIDVRTLRPVGRVGGVSRGASGDSTVLAAAAGAYAIRVAAGVYRAFVRDDTVLSVGRPERVRLP